MLYSVFMKPVALNTKHKTLFTGFTLVELLVVIAILGILAAIGLASFRNSQLRSRDAQRKSDLRQVANALELYYSDYEEYPPSSAGKLVACPDNSGDICEWDKGSEFSDGKTIYFREMAEDPGSNNYYYVSANLNQEYKLYSRLENTQDPSYGNDYGVPCGDENCNFGISSTNTTP